MVARFLDDNKPKIRLNNKFALFQTSSIFLFVRCSRNFLGLNSKGPYLSLEKEKETFRVVFTLSVKWAHENYVECRSPATMATKCAKKRDARAKLLFY